MPLYRSITPIIAIVFILLFSIPAITNSYATTTEVQHTQSEQAIGHLEHSSVQVRASHIENADNLELISDPGCTDSAACNYNASATSNNGSCLYIGDPCPNANLCTTNSVIDTNCDCVGEPVTCLAPGPCFTATCSPATGQCIITAIPDSDGDGICDAEDSCPSTFGEIGDPCPNADLCTTNSVIDANCNCVGEPVTCLPPGPCFTASCSPATGQCIVTAIPDSDGDGICDAEDNCPSTFGEIGDSCPDADACTTNSVINANCDCVGEPVTCIAPGPCFTAHCNPVTGCIITPIPDSDGDGICDAEDNCPSTFGEIGDPCPDADACTTNSVINANCDCVGEPVTCIAPGPCFTAICNPVFGCVITPIPDSDGDGICDAEDNCPTTFGQIGDPCDDGNQFTQNDALQANCLCEGFLIAGCTSTTACNYNCLATIDDGSCAVFDICGVCGGDNSSCLGCDGIPNSGLVNDDCGICGGDNSTCAGCDGIPNSGLVNDACGVCGGDNSSCVGCDGIPNSGLVNDDCGICGGDNSTCAGCDGIPNSGLVFDNCGVCDGNNSCAGCDGVPFSGLVLDDCGICGGTGIAGCTDPAACNYDPSVDCDDGSCIVASGCTYSNACNFDPSATCDNGTCEYTSCETPGCMVVSACNFNSNATIENGSCEYSSCAGCTYPESANYDPTMTIDDGSCTFDLASACPGDFNNDNEIDSSDLLAFLGFFGNNCTP